ncbi:MAG: MTH938/NDUFAF3 family protein [Legionellaceae bacterium]|nr:MTH938/NDUFAF3 family protein [Legionellaceae bacterium]
MQIQKESRDTYTIQAYDDTSIKLDDVVYHSSFIVSRDTLISPWKISTPTELNEALLQPILELNPEVIILGASQPDTFRILEVVRRLCEKQVGVECMSLGAASRTFNILLSEHRRVVAGFIF